MKKSLLFSVIQFAIAIAGFAQKNTISVSRKYSGTIDTYPIEVQIQQVLGSDSISGSYYYTRKGSDDKMDLSGTLKGNVLKMSETVYSRKLEKHVSTGSFLLNIDDAGNIMGDWTIASGKTLPVKAQSYLNKWTDAIIQWQFKPHFYRKKERNAGGSMKDYWAVNSINILDKNGKLVQKLSGFDEIIDEDFGVLQLEDINFDGYPDLELIVSYPQNVKNDWSTLYFVFDPATKKFVANTELNEIGILNFDPLTKTFSSYSADGSGNEGQSVYKWFGKKCYLMRTENTYEDKKGIFITEYKIQKGKSVVSKEYKK